MIFFTEITNNTNNKGKRKEKKERGKEKLKNKDSAISMYTMLFHINIIQTIYIIFFPN